MSIFNWQPPVSFGFTHHWQTSVAHLAVTVLVGAVAAGVTCLFGGPWLLAGRIAVVAAAIGYVFRERGVLLIWGGARRYYQGRLARGEIGFQEFRKHVWDADFDWMMPLLAAIPAVLWGLHWFLAVSFTVMWAIILVEHYRDDPGGVAGGLH